MLYSGMIFSMQYPSEMCSSILVMIALNEWALSLIRRDKTIWFNVVLWCMKLNSEIIINLHLSRCAKVVIEFIARILKSMVFPGIRLILSTERRA